MSRVLQPVDGQIKTAISNIIYRYAKGEYGRIRMSRWIEALMEQEGIKEIDMGGYAVGIGRLYGYTAVVIKGKGMNDSCPACCASPDNARYVRTAAENLPKDKDTVTVFCLECGTIYNTSAKYDWKGVTPC